MKVFDKVYRLDYENGMAEVLHTNRSDDMKIKEHYYFRDFFQRFSKMISVTNGAEADAFKCSNRRMYWISDWQKVTMAVMSLRITLHHHVEKRRPFRH